MLGVVGSATTHAVATFTRTRGSAQSGRPTAPGSLAEKATAQVSWDDLRVPLDRETNSIAVIIMHVGGNLKSRWTDALTTDAEKPWRDRDRECMRTASNSRRHAPRAGST